MRFNFKFRAAATPLRNHEGAPAYPLALYAAVATAGLSDQFYEAPGARLRELVVQNEPGLVARLAVYAREQLPLRSVPLVLAVELARIHHGDSLVSRLVARMVQRADEIPELLAGLRHAGRAPGRRGPHLGNPGGQWPAGLQGAAGPAALENGANALTAIQKINL